MADKSPPPRKRTRIRKKSRKELEREAERARLERLQFLGQLASGLAHEIRNPLNGIQLNVDLLRQDLPAVDESRREGFEKRLLRMRDEVDYLGRMVEEFLKFARPPTMKPMAVDIRRFLEELLEFQQPEFESRGIDVVQDFPEDLYPVAVDRHQFAQVIRNLLSNACDAIGEKGTITVGARQTDAYVEVSVADNGGGVPAEDEERIFNVFYTGRESGTGLGLAIASRIIDEHGGSIGLDNRPGFGAHFWVRLPKQKILTAELKPPEA
jgi:two-component system sensor histidine kinase HydH